MRKSMNVYAIKAYGTYGGGMAVVAADNEGEAKTLAEKAEASSWGVRYREPESVELLPCVCDGPARVLVHYETGE
jgi:hypothetical protein